MDRSNPGRPTVEALLSHVEWVKRLARLLVADAQDAADVEQETWRAALERPPRHAGQLKRWLAAVTRNVARKLARSRTTREQHESALLGSPVASTPRGSSASGALEVTARAEMHRRVVDAVLGLDELYRVPLLLRFFEDLPAQDVATRLGVPVETARTRIKRGLALVRARLGGELGVEGTAGLAAALAPLLAPRGAVAASTTAVGVSTAAGGAAAGAGIAGVLFGGAIVSKLGKVGAAVVVVGAAVFGSYRMWIEPRLNASRDRTTVAAPRDPAPAAAAAEKAPEPAAPAAERERVGSAAGVEPTRVAPIGVVEGRVVDAAGRPVGGALVLLGRKASDGFADARSFRFQLRRIQRAEESGRSWRSATSASDGSFTIEEVDPRDRFAIGAVADPGGAGWSDAVEFMGDPPRARTLVQLERGVVLFGTVRDPLGQPVPQASISISGTSGAPDAGARFSFFGEFDDFTVSGEDGSFRSLPLAWRHASILVWASGRPDLAQLHVSEELPAGATEVRRDLTLAPLTILRGRVLGPDGQPARLSRTIAPKLGADATRTQSKETIAVAAFEQDPRLHPEIVARLGTNEPGLLSLDPDHVYGALALDEDRYEIPLRSATLKFVAIVARETLLGAAEIPAPTVAPDVVIDPSLVPESSLVHALRLHFVDGRDGSPLAGVAVHAQVVRCPRDGPMTMSILNFGPPKELLPDRVLELPLAPCTIEMHREGFVPRSVAVDASRPGAPSELTIDFRPAGAPLTVNVSDEEGRPVAGARLRIYRASDHEPVVVRSDEPTDEHGACRLDALPAGECVVVAEADGFASSAATATIAALESIAASDAEARASEGGETVELELERGYEVTLRVRLEDGAPVLTGQYALLDEQGVPLDDLFHPRYGPRRLSGAKLRVVDGTYTIRCTLPGIASGSTKFVAAPGVVVEVKLEEGR
jgi:RNA polymerase sigma-70 factor (ECF subfamily)